MTKNIKELDKKNFNDFVSKGKSIAYFWAEWCGPCKMLKPVYEEVSGEMKDKVKFGKVDVDQEQKLAKEFEIMSIPTMVYFKNGEIMGTQSGFVDKKKLKELIKQFLG